MERGKRCKCEGDVVMPLRVHNAGSAENEVGQGGKAADCMAC